MKKSVPGVFVIFVVFVTSFHPYVGELCPFHIMLMVDNGIAGKSRGVANT